MTAHGWRLVMTVMAPLIVILMLYRDYFSGRYELDQGTVGTALFSLLLSAVFVYVVWPAAEETRNQREDKD